MQLLFYSCKFNEELFSLTLFLVSEFVCKGDKNCILYSIFELFDLQVLKSYGKSKRKGIGNKSKNAQEEEENRRSRGTAEPRSGENIQYPISFLHPLSMSYHFIITYPSIHWSVSIRQLRLKFPFHFTKEQKYTNLLSFTPTGKKYLLSIEQIAVHERKTLLIQHLCFT